MLVGDYYTNELKANTSNLIYTKSTSNFNNFSVISSFPFLFTISLTVIFKGLYKKKVSRALSTTKTVARAKLNSNLNTGYNFSNYKCNSSSINKSLERPYKKLSNLSELEGKLVLLRSDMNVPIENGKILDDSRILHALESLKYLVDRGAKVVWCTHLGRPKGPSDESSTRIIYNHIIDNHLLKNISLNHCNNIIGDDVEEKKKNLKNGEVILLENLRWDKGETKSSDEFSKELSKDINIYVNDAFSCSHRSHSSITGVTHYISSVVAGLRMSEEIDNLSHIINQGEGKQKLAIIGGAKLSSKLSAIQALGKSVDTIVIGGGMAFTFLKALGHEVGESFTEPLEMDALKVLETLRRANVNVYICEDFTIIDRDGNIRKDSKFISSGDKAVDHGEESQKAINTLIKNHDIIFWNGPMGWYERGFIEGSIRTAKEISRHSNKTSLVGGGDTISAIGSDTSINGISFVSTGGGAILEFIEGGTLPGIETLRSNLFSNISTSKLKPVIAINGFGAIGRRVLRAYLENGYNQHNFKFGTINIGSQEVETAIYLLKYDTTFGQLRMNIEYESNPVYFNHGDGIHGGLKVTFDDGSIEYIAFVRTKDISKLEWGKYGVNIVIDSSGKNNDRQGAQKHINQGCQKVILTAPAKDKDIPTYVIDVNDQELVTENVFSNASCTTNALAPMVKALDQAYGLENGFMLTVHAYTNDQRILDGTHKDLRRGRAAARNIIPTSTGAAKAVGQVLPHLEGKLDGMAVRVPTENVSMVYLTATMSENVNAQGVNSVLENISKSSKVLGYTDEPLVSTDFLKRNESVIVDSLLTKTLSNKLVQVVGWYDNEWGYSQRVLELCDRLVQQLK